MSQRGLKTAYALGLSAKRNEEARLAAELPENALLRGLDVVPIDFEKDCWWLRSASVIDDWYRVEKEGNQWQCTCDDFLLGEKRRAGKDCKHIEMVKAEIQTRERNA